MKKSEVLIAGLLFLSVTANSQTKIERVNSKQVAIEVHISPKGKGDGSQRKPFGSIVQARDKVRELRSAGEKGNIDVVLHDGTYTLQKTLVLNLSDGAPSGAITRYIASKDAHPVISGGRIITDWQKTGLQNGKIWVAKVPWAHGNEFFHCLFDGNELLQRAQSKELVISNESQKKFYAGELKYRYEFGFEDAGNEGQLKNWENLEDIELFGSPTREWLVNYLLIESLDMETKKGKLAIPATYRMGGSFVVENCLDHLDSPGEWALNSKKGLLYYWPKTGSPGESIIAPALNELIRIEGVTDPSLEGLKEKPVAGIVFEGIQFSHADRQTWLLDDIGIQHDWDMWDKANGLLRFRSAKNCQVNNCTFINSGSDGVRFDLFCQDNILQNSTFSNLGGTGILLCGYGPGKKDVNKRNNIHNNQITYVGTLFWHSPGIFVWQSGSNHISNNHIYNLGYDGLVVGGVRRRCFEPEFRKMGLANPYKQWLFPEGVRENLGTIRWQEITLKDINEWSSYERYMHARNNVIEYNEVHDCLKRLIDGNAVYLSANGDGNIVRRNVMYNHPKGALLRTDDDSHGVTVTENICIGSEEPEAQGLCMKGLNYFDNNLLFNAMLTTGGAGNTADCRSSIRKNILYFSKKDSIFHKGLTMFAENLNQNIYYCPDIKLAKNFISKEREGLRDTESIAADPQFVNLSKADFSFKDSSPAKKLGIKSITLDVLQQIGCSTNPWLPRALGIAGFPFITP